MFITTNWSVGELLFFFLFFASVSLSSKNTLLKRVGWYDARHRTVVGRPSVAGRGKHIVAAKIVEIVLIV